MADGTSPAPAAAPDADLLAMATQSDTGLNAVLGFEVTEAGPDRVVVTWTVGPQHLQPWGIVHGGVHCAAIEGAASIGAALWRSTQGGGQVVGVANHTDFLRAVGQGELTAVATPIHRGRSQQLWLVEVTDDRERAIARGQVRLQNLDS